MIDLRFVPIDLKDFPSPRPVPKPSKFKVGWQATLNLLDRELRHLGAKGVVLQADYRADQIRQDGWPLSRATPGHACVILSFRDSKDRPLSFPCGTFTDLPSNLRAIALSLEALRAVDRFGVTKIGEQYAGFKQLEAPKQWTVDDAAQFIAVKVGGILPAELIADAGVYRTCYRRVATQLHPDQENGNPYEWKLLSDAKALLDAHHRLGARAGS